MTGPDPVVTYGASTHGVRGDYADMRPDYTVTQDYSAYDEAQHDRWRRLHARQMRLVPLPYQQVRLCRDDHQKV